MIRRTAVLLAAIVVAGCTQPAPPPVATPAPAIASDQDPATAPPAGTTARAAFLAMKAGDDGIAPPPGHVHGAALEWNTGLATATLATLADGSTSLILSTGKGVPERGEAPAVRAAGRDLLAAAEAAADRFEAAADPAYPQEGQAQFLALTDRGVLRAGPVATADIEADGNHPLRPMYDRAQALLAQLRLESERDPGAR